MTSIKHYDIVILGAGMSGLSAAHYLAKKQSKQEHFNIALIEAQDRYGGRILTSDFGRGYVELGASVCHGANQANPVFNLACSYGLIEEMKSNGNVGAFLHSSGIAIDQTLATEVFDHFKASEFKTLKLNASDPKTLDQYIEDKVSQLKLDYPNEVHFLIDAAAFYCKRNCPLFGGDNCQLLSAWGFGAGVDIAGDVLIKGGYRSLLDRMVRECEDKVDLLLNEEALRIDWSNSVVQVQTTRSNYTCDYLLVTFPLGVLKACHQTLFTPQLPKDNVRGIENVGFGRVAKIYLEYDRPFWQQGTLNLKFLPDKEDREKVSQAGNELIDLIYGVEEVPTSSNVLIAWTTGEESVLIESYPEQVLAHKITDLLRLYTADLSIPLPSRVLTSPWNGNQFIRGFKSYPSTKTTSREDFARISKPLTIEGQERVFFAGEATHQYYFGTVHGARLSALNAANRIHNLWTQAK